MSTKLKPRSEIRTITPDWAMKVLQKHDKDITEGRFRQRPLSKRAVERYASDMRTGNWALNGQGISFDTDGNLIDGQHRLYAICEAKVSVDMLILWDVPALFNDKVKTIDTLDVGKNRNLAQQMRIEGFEYTTVIASASRLIAAISRKSAKVSAPITTPQGLQVASLIKNHAQQLIDILKSDSQISNIRGFILAPLVMLRSAEPDTADLFATEFTEMTNLSKSSPVLIFRKFMDRPSHVKGGTEYQFRVMKGLASALWAYTNEKKLDIIRGNDEHVEWLLATSKGLVKKIREIIGEP